MPEVLAMMLPMLSNAGNSIFNWWQQDRANKQNIAMQRETNALNYKIFQETNAYNSPQNQVAMLRAAGINPVTAYGGLSQTAKAVSPNMEAPRTQAALMDMSSLMPTLLQTIQTLQTQRKTEEEIKSLQMENAFKNDNLRSELENKVLSNKSLSQGIVINYENLQIAKKQLELQGLTVHADLANSASLIKLQSAQIENIDMQKEATRISNEIEKINLRYARARNVAEIHNLNESTNKLIAEAANLRQRTTNEELKTALGKVELSLALQTFDANKKFIESQATNESMKPVFDISKGLEGIGGQMLDFMEFKRKSPGKFGKIRF